LRQEIVITSGARDLLSLRALMMLYSSLSLRAESRSLVGLNCPNKRKRRACWEPCSPSSWWQFS